MVKLVIKGGNQLKGSVKISGSKNSCLPIIAASILAEEPIILRDVPFLSDVKNMISVLEHLGVEVNKDEDSLKIQSNHMTRGDLPPYDLISKMRASFLTAGPLLARQGEVKLYLPGGCEIGTRPIDLHLKGFKALGAEVDVDHGSVYVRSGCLTGERIYLDFPSVGATENIMMAAVRARGATVIENAAEEPEIMDLARFLNSLGAKVKGAGTKIIKIIGVDELGGATHAVIPDRIEAGTFMAAAAINRDEIILENVITEHLKAVTAKLKEAGAVIEEIAEGKVRVDGRKCYGPLDIKTLPYPGFPTDMQAQFMAMLTLAKGTSVVTETIFENRYMHVNELKRMGANIRIEGPGAIIQGVESLSGAKVRCTDLRAGASLVLAGLAAQGETEVLQVEHLDRGYSRLDEKFYKLGADIKRIEAEERSDTSMSLR